MPFFGRGIISDFVHGSRFYAVFNCILQPTDVTSDVIYGANVGQVDLDAPVKCGDSRSNVSRDIGLRLPHFIANDNYAGRWTRCQ